ncbi:cilia- and flagella-associated protein 97-like [Dreissena polymorpha]|uniref:Cilia- and flagella-associated protein 97 n=1 Tax=Dreissena polymorpha TaxID=45954 RepID=A0A9D4KE91_DREPO|nr:cilia- and flagella-associated protein 97-like [Dreissena polymorpha]KAH3838026.1 hypothetical protein DPMN_111431 [Dreissena polymorpha]
MGSRNEEVDFDFFDTPRDRANHSPKSKKSSESSKQTKSRTESSKHVEVIKGGDKNNRGRNENSRDRNVRRSSSESASDTDSETPRYRQTRNEKKAVNSDSDSETESSSAYSDSHISSDESDDDGNSRVKETIDIHMPKAHVEAWGEDGKNEGRSPRKNRRDASYNSNEKQKSFKRDSDSQSSDSEYSPKRHSSKGSKTNERVKSSKSRNGRHSDESKQRGKLKRSTSSSFSNNSDITDVSPLESPENSPRHAKRSDSRNGKTDKVQYEHFPDESADIKLETDQIDLSILMKCMADIDREKQQRLQNNSRRVMFASPDDERKVKPNYTFSVGRAKMIEKENQRLLKQIMSQMNTGPGTLKQTTTKPRGPKKAFEPAIQRLTPSAVNRMREQRRIESENMHILSRLQTIRPTRGISRKEQINEFERHMSYGAPAGTVLIPADEDPEERKSRAHSSLSHAYIQHQRSRPSSAGHYSTSSTGRRSRPSSAKSNASVMSNASVRSNASKRSVASVRSNMSSASRRREEKPDYRPPWDDRFSFS